MIKKSIAIAAILSIIISSLTGCGEAPKFLGGTPKTQADTVRSDEVFIPIEKIRTLNPIVSKDEDAYYVNKLIYESLFDYDENLTLVPLLAESYMYSPDGSSVTIKVKQGIHWQDGEEFNAEDVNFTMDALISASYANSTMLYRKHQKHKIYKGGQQGPLFDYHIF